MKLKLGKLPSVAQVKLALSLSQELKDRIDRYAQLHSTAWGDAVDAAAIIPHIVDQFLRSDKEFRRTERLRSSPS